MEYALTRFSTIPSFLAAKQLRENTLTMNNERFEEVNLKYRWFENAFLGIVVALDIHVYKMLSSYRAIGAHTLYPYIYLAIQ